MSPRRPTQAEPERVELAVNRLAARIAAAIRDERMARRWTIRELADRAGVAPSVVHDAEQGRLVSTQSWLRIALALDLRPDLTFTPARRRSAASSSDLVHAAMGELQAGWLRRPGLWLGIDEPYQHYQFAGRGDVLAVDFERRGLLHIENRTRFPNLQDVAGSYNAKRAYLPGEVARRLDVRRWASETHVIAALWSAEALHAIRLRAESFAALCPDSIDAFAGWWRADPPAAGRTSVLVVFDPAADIGGRRRFASLRDVGRIRPRYRDYADAARQLA